MRKKLCISKLSSIQRLHYALLKTEPFNAKAIYNHLRVFKYWKLSLTTKGIYFFDFKLLGYKVYKMNIELILNVTMYQTHRFLKTTTKIQNI